MNKKYLKFVGVMLFFTVFFAVNSCSKSDDNHTEDSENTEVSLPEEALRLQIVEASFSEPLTQEEYDGMLGDVPLKLVRESEQTLLFYIPGTVPVGEVFFSIPELKVSQKLNVKNAELRAAESVVLAPFFEKISVQYQGISTPEYMTYMTEVNTAFDNYYQSLSAAEKDEMALFFQVNEAFFDEVLNIDANGVRSVESTVRNAAKFTIASYLFVTCSTALTLPGTPVEKAVIGAVAVTGAVKAWDYGKQLINEVNIVNSMTQQILDEISATATTALDDSASLTFVHDESKSVSFYIEQQNMTSGNRSGTAESLVSFFDAYDVLTSATHTVNDVIRFINDHVFFANISEIPISEIPANAEKETVAMTSELFNYMTFSTPDNVILSQPSFANGEIAMKMTIANPDNVTDGVVQTQLNYTYEDAFNYVSGSIPIEVKLEEDSFNFEGTWRIAYYEIDDNSLYQEDKIAFNADGISTLYESRMPAHPDSYYHNWLEIPDVWTIEYSDNILILTNTAWGTHHRFVVESIDDTVFYMETLGMLNEVLYRE